MISGQFGSIGELLFEIDLIPAQGEMVPVEALLDTGFTTGWLALDLQDVRELGWPLIERKRAMQTARGETFFALYAGKVLIDGQQFDVPVHAGEGIPEVLPGLQWLKTLRLVVDVPVRLLTLG